MNSMLEVKELSYGDFNGFNLNIKKGSFTSIVGSIKSGKTTLFKIISGVIPTNNVCKCNGVLLNKMMVSDYLVNLGVVPCLTETMFLFELVKDELIYPLTNLGYSPLKIKRRVQKVLSDLAISEIYDQKLNKLDTSKKQLLLFAIALLHQPKVLLIDEGLLLLNNEDKKRLWVYLNRLKKEQGLTIVLLTNNLEDTLLGDELYLLDQFKIIEEGAPIDLLKDDQIFYQSGLEVPFMLDLSIKLKMYGLVDQIYLKMEDLVNKLWK